MIEDILVATSNPHKVEEIRAVLSPLGVRVHGFDEQAESIREPVEDAPTFEGNARIKALAYARALGTRCLAEDSGLEVDGLGGAPGVHSARYAGASGSRADRDQANNDKLLRELSARPDAARSARFVCAMCLAAPDGTIVFEVRATYEGVVTDSPRGNSGFGYDPLLFLPDVGKTSAELSPEQKNARSHRGQAARALAAFLAHG